MTDSRQVFKPTEREPKRDREHNPKGVRHPFKTKQDYMPVAKRPRYIAWKKRIERMQNDSSGA